MFPWCQTRTSGFHVQTHPEVIHPSVADARAEAKQPPVCELLLREHCSHGRGFSFFSRWIHAAGAQVQMNQILDVHVYTVCVLQHYTSIGCCFPETTIKTQRVHHCLILRVPFSALILWSHPERSSSNFDVETKGNNRPHWATLWFSSTAEWEKSEVMLRGLYQSFKLEMHWNKCCTVALLTTAQLLRHMIQPLTLTSIDTIKASHIRRII